MGLFCKANLRWWLYCRGWSSSNDGDVTGNHGGIDYWIIKLDDTGNLTWQKSLGGSGDDYFESIEQTIDGGYIVAGSSISNNGNVTGNHGGSDDWAVKLNGSGNISWEKSVGGTSSDAAFSVKQATDGGYIIAGYTASVNGDVTNNNGLDDYWIVKLAPEVLQTDTSIMPAHPRTEYANREDTDASGWTNYYFDNNTPNNYADDTLLLSLKKNGQNIGAIGDGTFAAKLVATAGAGSNTGIQITNPLIMNTSGFYVMNRYWQVTATAEPAANVGVRFYYNAQDLADVNGSYPAHNLTNQQLIFYKETGGSPDPTTNLAGATSIISIMPSTSASDTTWTYHQLTDTTQYAEFSVASFTGGGGGATGNGLALPINLLRFAAIKNGNSVVLQWSTASEFNSSYFEVLKSADGVNFRSIGKVNAKGNSNSISNYAFTDNKPNNGGNYYRLREVDADGKPVYSDIRFIKIALGFNVSIYPNPLHSSLTLNFNSNKAKSLRIRIADNQGKTVMMRQTRVPEGISTQTFNVASLSNGFYFVRCVSSDSDTKLKFVKTD